jgi:hypothetical protein
LRQCIEENRNALVPPIVSDEDERELSFPKAELPSGLVSKCATLPRIEDGVIEADVQHRKSIGTPIESFEPCGRLPSDEDQNRVRIAVNAPFEQN